MNNFFNGNVAVVSVFGLILSGCGGGSTENDPGIENTGSFTGIEFSGKAAKGIIENGVITAEELDTDGIPKGVVGSTTTDSLGAYKIEINDEYTGGPILVAITKGDSTQMKCDVSVGCGTRMDDLADSSGNSTVDFGEWYKPSNLSMTALVSGATANDVIGVNLTPYTHLAAQIALASESLDAQTISNANSEISNLLGGIDILNTQPIDITNATARDTASATETTYAALSSAIAILAGVDVNKEPDINSALSRLVSSFSIGSLVADDSNASNDNEIFSLLEIVDATKETLNEIGISDVSGVLANLENEIANATDTDGDGVAEVDPEPSDTAGENDLSKVKAMVNDIRTWGTVILEQTESPTRAFGEQIGLALDSIRLMDKFGVRDFQWRPIGRAVISYLFEGGSDDLSTYPLDDNYYYIPRTFESGLISQPSPETINIKGSFEIGDSFDITLKLPPDDSAVSSIKLEIISATTSNKHFDSSVEHGSITFNLPEAYVFDWDAINANTAHAPDIDSVEVDIAMSFTQKIDLSTPWETGQINELYEPITFSGSFYALIYVDTPINQVTELRELVWGTPSTLTLEGVITNTSGDSLDGTIALNISNAETFSPVSDDIIEDVDNWLAADMGVSFSLQLNELPEALISLTGNRTGFETGDLDLRLAFDNRSIVVSAVGDASSDTITGDITITNQDGVVLTLVPDSELKTGTISHNGKVYGSLYETTNGLLKIDYIDDTFEIF